MSQTTETQAHIHERDAEISKIAESIEELATIFKELSTLVIDQGTILDRIDYNMEEVVERTELGLQKLEKVLTPFTIYFTFLYRRKGHTKRVVR